MREQPEQQPPPLQRLRIRYAKRGRLRFTSHRDFSRAFERAVFRARVPMAYSSGFNPHPRISYAGAAPTGSASEAEYVEVALAEVVDPARVHASLSEALPDGLDLLEVVVSSGGSLAERLEASHWRITLDGIGVDAAREAVAALLDTPEVEVERMTKKGLRRFDARAAVQAASVRGEDPDRPGCAILDVVLRHGTPSVRPDDVLAALTKSSGLDVTAALQQRLAQGPLDEADGTVGDPLAPDRDAAPR
ncbi:radical SAM protein [Marmoricola sp. Leaf446]|uniref:TIGR03936 family radical SAM-associated protein n=1 Tax=Marmoricola sp. Leaf446 TaxID=1736379 RepID=UPI0006F5F965|nr:TIGR03936 family radical SAM-associated protein [Marmoricola sp. Leaf446]KQT89447.1 radical SAM protein [Marmoricola sp. Leaf446]